MAEAITRTSEDSFGLARRNLLVKKRSLRSRIRRRLPVPVAGCLFLTADGEKDQILGNLTIRWNPDESWVEVKLPTAVTHDSTRTHRLSRDELGGTPAGGSLHSHLHRQGEWSLLHLRSRTSTSTTHGA